MSLVGIEGAVGGGCPVTAEMIQWQCTPWIYCSSKHHHDWRRKSHWNCNTSLFTSYIYLPPSQPDTTCKYHQEPISAAKRLLVPHKVWWSLLSGKETLSW